LPAFSGLRGDSVTIRSGLLGVAAGCLFGSHLCADLVQVGWKEFLDNTHVALLATATRMRQGEFGEGNATLRVDYPSLERVRY
jgi:hypothetical protein